MLDRVKLESFKAMMWAINCGTDISWDKKEIIWNSGTWNERLGLDWK